MTETDETTKLVIYGLGLGAVLFFAYLIYRDATQKQFSYSPIYERERKYGFMTEPSSSLEQIEQKLLQLEAKIDNFTKSNTTISSSIMKSLDEQPQRKVVSMSSRTKSLNLENKHNRLEYFGMQ